MPMVVTSRANTDSGCNRTAAYVCKDENDYLKLDSCSGYLEELHDWQCTRATLTKPRNKSTHNVRSVDLVTASAWGWKAGAAGMGKSPRGERREIKRKQQDKSQNNNVVGDNIAIQCLNNPQSATTQQSGNLQRQNTMIISRAPTTKQENDEKRENVGNNISDTDTQKNEELCKEINEICAELNKFYTDLPHSIENLKRQDDLLTNINQALQNVENISTLEDCAKIKIEDISQVAFLKHHEALNNLTFKWWKHLNDDD
ncbi:hypothetical protein Trydic_g8559 [Trypoxylus dichotomus]